MSWYDSNNNGWYNPSEVNYGGGSTPPPTPDNSNMPGGKHTRTLAIVFCSILILVSIIVAGIYGSSPTNTPNRQNADGMPADWKEYYDTICSANASVSAEYKLKATDGKFDLALDFGDGSSPVLSYKEIYDKCAPSVVGIKAYKTESSTSYGWGSGMIASSDGYILTNAHVIDQCIRAEVILFNGQSFDALLAGVDTRHDVAVLKIDAEGLSPVSFAHSGSLSVGDSVVAIGNPIGPDYSLSLTSGIISAPERTLQFNGSTSPFIQTDVSINNGSSGGPLINDRGLVVGITNMKLVSSFSTIEGMAFAVPSDTVELIAELLRSDTLPEGDPVVGVTLYPVVEELADYYDIPQGLYVAMVNEGSDAEAKGIRKSDIIIKVNGKEVISNDQIVEMKKGLKIGDTMKFTVWREGDTLDFTVTLSDSNQLYYKQK